MKKGSTTLSEKLEALDIKQLFEKADNEQRVAMYFYLKGLADKSELTK